MFYFSCTCSGCLDNRAAASGGGICRAEGRRRSSGRAWHGMAGRTRRLLIIGVGVCQRSILTPPILNMKRSVYSGGRGGVLMSMCSIHHVCNAHDKTDKTTHRIEPTTTPPHNNVRPIVSKILHQQIRVKTVKRKL